MEAHEWPDGLRMRVRMGVHAGEVQETDDDDLLGMSINHAARIAAAAHGGQIVLSEAVRQMAHQLPDGVEVRSLGTHRLRDVGSITLFQVEHPDLQHDFPPPRGAIGYRTNLPRIRTPFVGGDRLLEAIGEHLDAANLVTLTGTGGVGKTRAAVEYGLSRLDDLDQGVFFVDLAPVSDTGAVIGAIASTLPIIAGGDQLLMDTVVDVPGMIRGFAATGGSADGQTVIVKAAVALALGTSWHALVTLSQYLVVTKDTMEATHPSPACALVSPTSPAYHW